MEDFPFYKRVAAGSKVSEERTTNNLPKFEKLFKKNFICEKTFHPNPFIVHETHSPRTTYFN